MSTVLDDMLSRFQDLPEQAREGFAAQVHESTKGKKWFPNIGQQTEAYLCEADILLYGGSAGGGKTHLELGWGINEAQSGIIFRREGTQTDGLKKEGKKIIGDSASFNGVENEWTWGDGKSLKLAGMPQPDDWGKHAGRERDYYAFDEAGEFLEMQVASILAWLRAPPGQRTRVVLGSNPPRTSDGLWMIKWFAPWLDDTYPDPAVPGELRWAYRITTEDEVIIRWVEGPGTYTEKGENGEEEYIAQSYTFIPASLHDNPFRDTPEYRSQLQSLPEPLRSQLLYGKFSAGLKDQENQIIPTDWVRMAFDRWTPEIPTGAPMCAIGVDCSGGGTDPMVMAPRYDGWYAPLIKVPASEIERERAGSQAAGLIVSHRRHDALVVVDMSGGYGGPLYERLHDNKIPAQSYMGGEKTARKSKTGNLKFSNTRSAAYWLFREALDPDQSGGSCIALKKDNRLLAGLTAVTFEIGNGVIKAEPKVTYDKKGRVNGGVKHKLGYSPDEADAVIMGWFYGDKHKSHAIEWMDHGKYPSVVASARMPLSAKRRRH
jgi:hypothetical protein